LQQQQNTQLDKSKSGAVRVQFGIGTTTSIGSVNVDTPLGTIEFHIVDVDTPFLLCLKDMDSLGAYFNNVSNKLHVGSRTYSVVRRFGHAFFVWGRAFAGYVTQYLSEPELRQLHRRFGHPSVRRFIDLLHHSSHDTNRQAIERLTRRCTTCQKNGASPRRFKFTLRDPDMQFNHTIVVDIFYLTANGHQNPVLHVVDEATRFQAARWLKDVSSQTVWNNLRYCWIDTYLGPPDVINHDQGKQFVSEEFRQLAASMAITTVPVPIEAHNSIGLVERYHGPLRRAYDVITEDLKGTSVTKEIVLQMAVKAVNDTAGPNGLVPTLLVFGAYPRMTELDPPAPSITVRARAITKAMAEVARLRVDRQIADALRQRNGPQTDQVRHLPLNSKVLVWREGKGWKGPFALLAVAEETCTVELPSGPALFRSTVVKPYLESESENEDKADERIQPDITLDQQPDRAPNRRAVPQEVGQRRNPTRDRRMPQRYGQNVDTFWSEKENSDLALALKLRAEGKITTDGPPFFLSLGT
jgi:transposase InsO family protein